MEIKIRYSLLFWSSNVFFTDFVLFFSSSDAAPSSQSVSYKWELSWPWYLASTRNYVVAKIDARGSGFQGIKMRREIQRRIGLIEVQDQLAVLTYLRDTFKFIDRCKICTIGKGYGGFVSAMMLLQDFHQVINCSVSISPITNWRYYSKCIVFNCCYLDVPLRTVVKRLAISPGQLSSAPF